MMDNENEFMIVCVFLWLFVVFVGAGCSDEWKEREEVWNKKMKHRSGSAHKQLFYSEFVIRVGIRIVGRGFFEAIFFFHFFLSTNDGFIVAFGFDFLKCSIEIEMHE